MRARVPGKVVQYWCGPRGLSQEQVARWMLDQQGWADDLRAALDDHRTFAEQVERMALAIREPKAVGA